ncbi:MAG: hypothetical protein IKI93_00585 [Clostridia bacterium]|nr:hypothetical protein [Clostridia bacterium]
MKKHVFSFVFVSFLLIFGVLHVILPDQAISRTERRSLAQFPSVGLSSVTDGVFMQNMEKYLPDQFPFREGFRSVKSLIERLSGRLDVNDIYDTDGYLASLEFGYSEDAVIRTADKLKRLREIFSACPSAVICPIPPKNFYLHDGIHPVPDFHGLERLLAETLTDYGFCGISDTLTQESYYRTDSHWRQEMLDDTAAKICASLGVGYVTEVYTEYRIGEFYGVWAGQSALPVDPDVLVYRVSPSVESASVTAVGSDMNWVYTPEKIDLDPYDVFLGGAVPVVEIVNENGTGDLIVVRDSFGASLIPLLIPSFHRITAVDLRYISSEYLFRYVKQDDASLLILLSAGILNNSEMLKIR